MRKVILSLIVILFSISRCNSSGSNKSFSALLLFLGAYPKSSIASVSKIELPNGLSENVLSIESSDPDEKPISNSGLVAITPIYDIKIKAKLIEEDKTPIVIDPNAIISAEFNGQKAEIEFEYDPEKLSGKNLNEEFHVLYFNQYTGSWESLTDIRVDTQKHKVTALTTHFTEFILTAVPKQNFSNIASIPACLQADLTNINLQGVNGNAKFTIVGKGFQYYQDRSYEIKQSAGDFEDLGFEGSLAIATCQGDTPAAGTTYCGTSTQHKYNNTSNYISFTAHTDIDVYVLYDSRGPANGSKNASWLSTFQDIGKNVYTNDVGLDPSIVAGANGYKVFRKTYTQGSNVVLGGDWEGFASNTPGHPIQSNYWVILKRANTFGVESKASQLCITTPPTIISKSPKMIHSFSGSLGRSLLNNPIYQNTLIWENPRDPEPYRIVIRRSEITVPSTLMEGEAPSGTNPSDQSFVDTGLELGKTYYYGIFAVDENLNYNGFSSLVITVRPDTDEDGISDFDEGLTDLNSLFSKRNSISQYSNISQFDSDSDGIPDGTELAKGTDPTDPDIISPNINSFTIVQNIGYLNSLLKAEYIESDNVKVIGWYLGKETHSPLSYNSYWELDPIEYYPTPNLGNTNLTLWVKDAAGNVTASNPAVYTQNPFQVKAEFVIFGCQPYCENVSGNQAGFSVYKWNDDSSLNFSDKISTATSKNSNTLIAVDSINSVIYTVEKETNKMFSYGLNRSTGKLAKISEASLPAIVQSNCDILDFKISPNSLFSIVLTKCGDAGFPGVSSQAYISGINNGIIQYKQATILAAQTTIAYSILFGSNDSDVFVNTWRNSNSVISTETARWYLNPINASLTKDSAISPYQETSTYNASVVSTWGNTGFPDSWFNMGFSNSENLYTTHICAAEYPCQQTKTFYKLSRFTVNSSSYQLLDKKTYETGATILSSASDPSAKYYFLLTLYPQISSNSFLETIRYSDNTSGNFTSVQSIPNLSYNLIKYEPVSGRVLLSNGAYNIGTYDFVNPSSGGNFLKSSTITSGNVNSIHFVYSAVPNLSPVPVVNFNTIVRRGSVVGLNSADSFDPDASKCGTTNSAMTRSWQILSKPIGSIATLNSPNGIATEFTADMIGNYKIRFTLTDSPGTCGTVSQSKVKDVNVRVAYRKTYDFFNLPQIPSVPGDAIPGLTATINLDDDRSTKKEFGNLNRNLYIILYQTKDIGEVYNSNIETFLTGGAILTACSVNNTTKQEGKKYCDTIAPPGIFFLPLTNPILVVTADTWQVTELRTLSYGGRILYWSDSP